jgi:hypothetical protein
LDAESAASSGRIAGDIRAGMVEEAERNDVALRLLGGVAVKVCAQGGLEPAFKRECADLDRVASEGESSQVQRFFESLGYVPQTLSNARKSRSRWAGRCTRQIGDRKRWYDLPEEVDGGP